MWNWYRAEDEKGISALTRVTYRLNLKKFLIAPLQFNKFPPYGSHVLGMSRQMLEGFLQGIDTKLQLYAITRKGTYNPRAITSLTNETFFGDMTDMEPTKLGCQKAVSIRRLISNVTELMHYRYNPSSR